MSQPRFNPSDHPLSYLAPISVGDAGSWIEHTPFAAALVDMLKPSLVVELGSQFGDSYFMFCQAIKALNLDTQGSRAFAVDTWQGDPHTGMYDESTYNFVKHANTPYTTFSTLLRKKFDEALSDFTDKSIDLLHIDGLHTYEAVSHDFNTWLPKVSDRGVILFHDTQVKHSDFGVWKLWEEISTKYPSFEFPFGHGLGVLVTGPNAPQAVLQFIEQSNSERDAVVRHFGSLGRGASTTTAYLMLARRAFNALAIANQWRQATSQPVDPNSQNPNMGALEIGTRILNELTTLANSEFALRQKIAQPTSPQNIGGITGVMRL